MKILFRAHFKPVAEKAQGLKPGGVNEIFLYLKESCCVLAALVLSSCFPLLPHSAQNSGVHIIDDSGDGYVHALSRHNLGFGENYFRRISAALQKSGTDRFRYSPVMIDNDLVSLLVERTQGSDEFVQKLFSGVSVPGVHSLDSALKFMRTQTKYRKDQKVFGRDDVWQSSNEMAERRIGDCEDHAILLADLLMGMGKNVRVVFGDYRGAGHVWIVIIEKEGTTKLIEATSKNSKGFMKLSRPTDIPEYYPYIVFDNRFLYKLRPGGNPRDMNDWEESGEYISQ